MRVYSKIVILTLVFFGILACKNEPKEAKDTTLDIRIGKMPQSLHPILYPSLAGREIYQNLFLPMADINENTQKIEPILLSEIGEVTKVAGNYWLPVTVRNDAKWEDGTSITAADIAFTFLLIKHPQSGADNYRSLLAPLKEVQIDPSNPLKCKFIFSEYLMNLKESVLNTEILPKHIYDPKGLSDQFTFADMENPALANEPLFSSLAAMYNAPKFNFDVVKGSGPYQIVEYNKDIGFTLKKVENYWGKALNHPLTTAEPDQIKFSLIPYQISALTALASGKIDVMSGVSAENFKVFSDTSKDAKVMQLVKTQIPRYFFYYLNHKSPLLQDINVRKALRCVVDANQYISTFESGDATAMTSFVPPFLPGYNDGVKKQTCDFDGAKKILTEAGYKDENQNGILDKKVNGKVSDLNISIYPSGELSVKFAILLKDAAAKAGINIDVQQKEFAVIQKEHLSVGKFDIVPSMASLDITMENPYDWYHSSNIGTSNLSNYSSPKADSLINIVTSTTDDKKRLEAFKLLQQTIYDDVAMIYLYAPKDRIAVSNKWQPIITIKRPGYRANLFRYLEK